MASASTTKKSPTQDIFDRIKSQQRSQTMTKEDVFTLDDALHFDCERCAETLKEAFDHVRKIHPDKSAALQVICLHRALMKVYTEHPETLFLLTNAVIGKFLIPELTPEEQYSVRMYDIRPKEEE